jgi:hypothetical protein
MLIGTEGTGKTCFLAGLAVLGLNPINKTPLHIYAQEETTKKYLNNLKDTLQNGSWVPPTNTSPLIGFDLFLNRSKKTVRLQMLDYSGESFRKAFNELTPETAQMFSEHIAKSEVVLLLLDANDLLNAHDENLRRLLNEKIQAQLAAVWEKTGRETDIGILVTKSDTIPELKSASAKTDYGARAAEQFVKEHLDDFMETLRKKAKMEGFDLRNIRNIDNRTIVFYPVSAVGETDPETGRPVKNGLTPFGYDAVFQWIAARQKRYVWRKFLFILACMIVFLGIGCFFFAGSTIELWRQENDFRNLMNHPHLSVHEKLERARTFVLETNNMRELRIGIIDKALVSLQERVSNARDIRALEEIRSELVTLEELGVGGLENELRILKEKVDETLKGHHFAQVKTAHEVKSSDFEFYAKQFLDRYPNAPEGETVHEWLYQASRDRMRTAKSRIHVIAVTSPLQLQNKAERISSFLRDFDNELKPDERKEIRDAVDLAKKFLESTDYTVTLKRYGGFAYMEDILLKITANGVVHEIHRSSGKVQTANPGKTFNVRWKSGERIDLEIQAYAGRLYGGVEKAASIGSNETDAVVLLNGRTQLTPAVHSWDWRLPKYMAPGGYFVECEIQGISREQWKAFENYVKPGNKWREEP